MSNVSFHIVEILLDRIVIFPTPVPLGFTGGKIETILNGQNVLGTMDVFFVVPGEGREATQYLGPSVRNSAILGENLQPKFGFQRSSVSVIVYHAFFLPDFLWTDVFWLKYGTPCPCFRDVPCLCTKVLSRLYPCVQVNEVCNAKLTISYALSCMYLRWTGYHTGTLSFLLNKARAQ